MKNTSKIIIIIIATAIFFIGYYLLSIIKPSEKDNPQVTVPTPSPISIPPTDTINATPPTTQKDILPNLIHFLPFDSQEFSVEFYGSTQAVVVTIKESPYEENKKKAQDWLQNHGITNLNDLKIIYTSYRWVR